MESNSGIILTGKIEVLGEKPAPVSLLPPRITCTTWSRTRAFAVRGWRLSPESRHGVRYETAVELVHVELTGVYLQPVETNT